MDQKRILVVDDEKLISWALHTTLEKHGFQVQTAATGAEAEEQVAFFRPHLLMLDLWLPDANGIELLKKFKGDDNDLAIIMMTADAHVDSAISALKYGAEDFIAKPFNTDLVLHAINQILEKKQLKLQVDLLNKGRRHTVPQDKLVGHSAKMIDIFKMIKVCAETDSKTVLILGESGTGKELVAQAIHAHSARVAAPFIEVNCAAIPDNLLENELFGHERGAYTDASKKQKGIFELAEGGTVFLDEIGDMPLQMQAKVLKIIETKRFRRLGGEEDVAADVRIIAATHQDLPRMVAEKKFRGDLFFRLNVMSLRLPPLRERLNDIESLTRYFISCLNEEYGKSIIGVTDEALAYMMQYDWPGNVRELKNCIERAMMLEPGSILSATYLTPEIRQNSCTSPASMQSQGNHFPLPQEGISLEEVEIHLIRQALEKNAWNQSKAARYLKMSRDTLRYRMKKYDISEPNGQPVAATAERDLKTFEFRDHRPSPMKVVS